MIAPDGLAIYNQPVKTLISKQLHQYKTTQLNIPLQKQH